MKLDEVTSKDGALLWLKEKIDERWNASQIRDMISLTTGIPIECRTLLHKLLVRMEVFELESWAHKREIKCQKCGYSKTMTIKLSSENGAGTWIPKMKCPKCSSEKFYPVTEEEVVKKPRFQKYMLRKHWRVNPIVGAGLILALFLSLFVTIRSGSTRAGKLEKVVFICMEDGDFFIAPISAYPIECPNCGRLTGMMAVQCEECGHIYTWLKIDWVKQPPVCPKCGSKKSTLLSKIPK